jgi:NADH:ubiquinone oxidoreductase subunit K
MQILLNLTYLKIPNEVLALREFALPYEEAISFTLLIYFIGLAGIMYNYKNFLVTMLCVELMYLGIISSFIVCSVFTFDPKGQIYALIFLIVAAAESAIGLGILVVSYRFGKSIDFEAYQELRG